MKTGIVRTIAILLFAGPWLFSLPGCGDSEKEVEGVGASGFYADRRLSTLDSTERKAACEWKYGRLQTALDESACEDGEAEIPAHIFIDAETCPENNQEFPNCGAGLWEACILATAESVCGSDNREACKTYYSCVVEQTVPDNLCQSVFGCGIYSYGSITAQCDACVEYCMTEIPSCTTYYPDRMERYCDL